ncbi:MAG: chromate transporter [Pseudomonadota bacterium]
MNSTSPLMMLGLYFLSLSLMAIGGANVVIPDMHRQFIDIWHWMSSKEFVSLVALSQAAPGPNVLIVSLLGWKVAGIKGALVATAGMCIPSSLLTFFFSKCWNRFQQNLWREVVQTGLVYVTVGLILASSYVLTRSADHSWIAYGVTGITVLLMLTTRIHPLWLLAVAGVLGYVGLI